MNNRYIIVKEQNKIYTYSVVANSSNVVLAKPRGEDYFVFRKDICEYYAWLFKDYLQIGKDEAVDCLIFSDVKDIDYSQYLKLALGSSLTIQNVKDYAFKVFSKNVVFEYDSQDYLCQKRDKSDPERFYVIYPKIENTTENEQIDGYLLLKYK